MGANGSTAASCSSLEHSSGRRRRNFKFPKNPQVPQCRDDHIARFECQHLRRAISLSSLQNSNQQDLRSPNYFYKSPLQTNVDAKLYKCCCQQPLCQQMTSIQSRNDRSTCDPKNQRKSFDCYKRYSPTDTSASPLSSQYIQRTPLAKKILKFKQLTPQNATGQHVENRPILTKKYQQKQTTTQQQGCPVLPPLPRSQSLHELIKLRATENGQRMRSTGTLRAAAAESTCIQSPTDICRVNLVTEILNQRRAKQEPALSNIELNEQSDSSDRDDSEDLNELAKFLYQFRQRQNNPKSETNGGEDEASKLIRERIVTSMETKTKAVPDANAKNSLGSQQSPDSTSSSGFASSNSVSSSASGGSITNQHQALNSHKKYVAPMRPDSQHHRPARLKPLSPMGDACGKGQLKLSTSLLSIVGECDSMATLGSQEHISANLATLLMGNPKSSGLSDYRSCKSANERSPSGLNPFISSQDDRTKSVLHRPNLITPSINPVRKNANENWILVSHPLVLPYPIKPKNKVAVSSKKQTNKKELLLSNRKESPYRQAPHVAVKTDIKNSKWSAGWFSGKSSHETGGGAQIGSRLIGKQSDPTNRPSKIKPNSRLPSSGKIMTRDHHDAIINMHSRSTKIVDSEARELLQELDHDLDLVSSQSRRRNLTDGKTVDEDSYWDLSDHDEANESVRMQFKPGDGRRREFQQCGNEEDDEEDYASNDHLYQAIINATFDIDATSFILKRKTPNAGLKTR